MDDSVLSIFRVLQDPAQAARLQQLLNVTPYSRSEFELAYEKTDDPVERARRTLVRSWMGYGSDGTAGVYRTGFRNIVTQAGKTPASEWANWKHAIAGIVDRIDGVTLERRDAFLVIEQYDGPETLHYVDPPYLPETRSKGNRRRGAGFHVYQHELTVEDHARLLGMLQDLQGMVVLSGYPSMLYEDALVGWRREQRAAYADGGAPRTEVVWINPRCQERLEAEARERHDDVVPLFAHRGPDE